MQQNLIYLELPGTNSHLMARALIGHAARNGLRLFTGLGSQINNPRLKEGFQIALAQFPYQRPLSEQFIQLLDRNRPIAVIVGVADPLQRAQAHFYESNTERARMDFESWYRRYGELPLQKVGFPFIPESIYCDDFQSDWLGFSAADEILPGSLKEQFNLLLDCSDLERSTDCLESFCEAALPELRESRVRSPELKVSTELMHIFKERNAKDYQLYGQVKEVVITGTPVDSLKAARSLRQKISEGSKELGERICKSLQAEPNLVCTKMGDLNFVLYRNDTLAQNILRQDRWEPHLEAFFKLVLRTGDNVVDIGAHYGLHTITCSHLVGLEGLVYAFEPQPKIFELLDLHCRINNIENVALYQNALGHQQGMLSILQPDYSQPMLNSSDVSVARAGGRGVSVECLRLDSLELRPIKLIKIDVQGFERFVLEGSQGILERDRPYLVVEFEEHQLRKFGYGCSDLFNYLHKLNYDIVYLEYDYPSDHICVPNERMAEFKEQFHRQLVENDNNDPLNNSRANGVLLKFRI